MCMLCSRYVIDMYVLATSYSPTLNPPPQIPYFCIVSFVHAVFGVVGNLFFVFFCLYTYTIFFVGGV